MLLLNVPLPVKYSFAWHDDRDEKSLKGKEEIENEAVRGIYLGSNESVFGTSFQAIWSRNVLQNGDLNYVYQYTSTAQ